MGRSTLQIRVDDDYGQSSPSSKKSCCSCFSKQPPQKQAIKEISRELYPKEWNPTLVDEDEDMLANTQIIEQTVEGEEEDPRPAVQVEDMDDQGDQEAEESKDNQIEEQKNEADMTMREDNSTPFIISEKAHGVIAGMQTGLVKDSLKAQDLNAQIDFGK